jgi:Cu/Ag efflux protein CusF
MRAWKAVVLLNLALVVGVGWGYVFWGLRAARLERELAAARASALAGVERQWVVEGVVRAIFPELEVLVITHGDIADFMPAMTMGFRVASPKIQEAVSVGDEVRFTLRGVPPNVAVTAIQRISR